MPDKGTPVGETMRYWIGRTLEAAREDRGLDPGQMATAIDGKEATIKKWEKGKHFPRDIDQALAAYAYVLGRKDGLVFWTEAVERWRADRTELPRFIPKTDPAGDYADKLRQESLQQQADAPDSHQKPDANQPPSDQDKKRAK